MVCRVVGRGSRRRLRSPIVATGIMMRTVVRPFLSIPRAITEAVDTIAVIGPSSTALPSASSMIAPPVISRAYEQRWTLPEGDGARAQPPATVGAVLAALRRPTCRAWSNGATTRS